MISVLQIPVCGVDPALGRLDYSSLSQQALMEMLIEGLEAVGKICGSREEPKEVEDWEGVDVEDTTGDVTKIDWESMGLKGLLDVQWMPATVRYFDASVNDIIGSFNPSDLPASIETALLYINSLTGPIDLRNLLEGIQKFDISHNQLSGSIDLRHLPQSTQKLALNDNSFTGSVCLKNLPNGLEVLNIAQNDLSGSMDLTNLPASLKKLYLHENRFAGEVNLQQLPTIKSISLSDNAFSGSTDFSRLPESVEYLDVSNTLLSGEMTLDDSLWGGFDVNNSSVIKNQMPPREVG
ncbi:leucine-rich repeat protein [Perkinsela sp. CCAP 1560/4]|nr:leucine-rich repeat protein [Perkinsela sp. CCAP 1560/4]KNH08937.1 leucine-rich repeat protein [Perkinsela sp. CCAP 1560/4]|eukprot:KNH04303.1 leucine-rich repeat protein [Perkinsela sp. CCAP 1560/4]